MHYNVHIVPKYANPKGNYGAIVDGHVSGARAIDMAKALAVTTGEDYVVSTGLITIFDSRTGNIRP